MNCRFAWLLMIASASLLLAHAAAAEPPKEGTIVASGLESVRVQPTMLRLEVQLHVNGEKAEKAVEQLKARRKAAMEKLKELKAEEGSIHVSNTVITRVSAFPSSGYGVGAPGGTYVPSAPPMQLMPTLQFPPPIAPDSGTMPEPTPAPPFMPLRIFISSPVDTPRPTHELALEAVTPPTSALPALQEAVPGVAPMIPPGGFAPAQPTPVPAQLDASTTLRAEWRLTTSDPDAMALAGEALRQKLAAAHVFGDPIPEGPYPVPTGYPTPFGAGTNGGFTLSFVGTLSDTRRKAALETAMARARQRAAELAELAGGGRGNLCYLASDISSDINRGMPTVVYYTPNQAYFQSQDPSNVVGQSPDLPELTVQVTLNYHLVPKNP